MIQIYGTRYKCDNPVCGAMEDRGPLAKGADWNKQPVPDGWLKTGGQLMSFNGRMYNHLCPVCATLPVSYFMDARNA